jgi:hypothetical protein
MSREMSQELVISMKGQRVRGRGGGGVTETSGRFVARDEYFHETRE